MMMLSATGCAINSSVSDYCLIMTPPVYTNNDVDVMSSELARWLLEQSDKYDALCGGE